MDETAGSLTEQIRQSIPFADLLGVEIISLDPDEVRGSLAWDQRCCTGGGVMHGGALMALADTVGAVLAFLNLPEGSTGTTTVSSTTNFLRAVRDGSVTAVARLLHRGRTLIVVETDLIDASGRRVARVTQTQAVLHG